jgi:hypothetical protein
MTALVIVISGQSSGGLAGVDMTKAASPGACQGVITW